MKPWKPHLKANEMGLDRHLKGINKSITYLPSFTKFTVYSPHAKFYENYWSSPKTKHLNLRK